MRETACPGAWVTDAACAGHTDTMTMPSNSGRYAGSANNRHIAYAKTLCATCPVRTDCLAWALTVPDPARDLIAGGLTPAERVRRGAT